MGETGTLANGNATTSTATSTVDVVVPAEVENTLNRLSAYRHVRGVMILARSQASTPASSNNDPNIPATGGIIQFTGNVFEGDSGKKYAHALEGVVGTVAQAITDCEEGVSNPAVAKA